MNNTAKYYFNLGVENMLIAGSLAHSGKMDEAHININDAIGCYDKAIEIDPSKAIFFSAKGFSLKQLGATLEAGEFFEKSIELDPGFTESYYQLSLCFFEHSLIQSGRETFEEALALHEDKKELILRFYEDLLELINRHLFYINDVIRMGHKDNILEMTKKVIDVINFTQTFDCADIRLDYLFRQAKVFIHTPVE